MSKKATIADKRHSWTPVASRKNMCASSNCDETATWRFDVGGVGSVYCDDCKSRIEKLIGPKDVEVLHVGSASMALPCGGREVTHATAVIKTETRK